MKVSTYLGFSKICSKIITENSKSTNGIPASDFAKIFTNRNVVVKLLPYFKECLRDFIYEEFKYSASITYYNLYLDGVYLLGLAIDYDDIPGCSEYYIVKIIDNGVQLVGLPTDIGHPGRTPNLDPISINDNILDMSNPDNNVGEVDPFVRRTIIERDTDNHGNGLRTLLTFTAEETRGSDHIGVLCNGNISISTESVFGALKSLFHCKCLSTYTAAILNNVKALYSSMGIFKDIENYKILSPLEYATLWYGITEKLSYDDAYAKGATHVNGGTSNETIYVKTIADVPSTLYYNIGKDSFYIDSLNNIEENAVAIIEPNGMDGRTLITHTNDYASIDEKDSDQLMAESHVVGYGKNVYTFKYDRFKILAMEAAEAVSNIPKENPADKVKISGFKSKADAVVAGMTNLKTDSEKDAYYNNKIMPLVKDGLLIAYAVGFILYPLIFGMISYLILSYIALRGIDNFKTKLGSINNMLDGFEARVRGKTDAKSMAFASNIKSLKDSIANKLKSKKADDDVKDTAKEMVSESFFINMIKKDMIFSNMAYFNESYGKNDSVLYAESLDTIGSTVMKYIFGIDINKRTDEYLGKIKAAGRHLPSGINDFNGTLDEFMVKFDVVINPIIAGVIHVALLILLFKGAFSGFALTGILVLFATLGIKGDSIYGLILEVIDAMAIYVGYEKNGKTNLVEKYKSAFQTTGKGLNQEDIDTLNALKDTVDKDPKLQAELKEKTAKMKEVINRHRDTSKEAVQLDSEAFNPESHNILMCEGILSYGNNTFTNLEFLHKLEYVDVMFAEASIAETSDKIFEAIKGLPRDIYTKYKEYISRMKSYVSKIKQARDDEEREEILNKEFLPAYDRLLYLLTSAGAATILVKLGLINPLVGIIGVILTRIVSNFVIKEKKKRALAILRNEMSICEEALNDAKNDNNRPAKFAIMSTKNKLQDMLTSLETRF